MCNDRLVKNFSSLTSLFFVCVHPLLIKNPNYRKSGEAYKFKDTKSQFIYVPCGYCSECIAVRQMYLVQRVQMESLNNHLFFATLTYCDEFLPYIEVNDFVLRYADLKHLQLMFKRIRNNNLFGRPFRYFAVSERGKKGRPHFHILFLIPKYDDDDFNTCLNLEKKLYDSVFDNWVINLGSTKKPDYKPLCEFHSKIISGKWFRNYDLHYVNPSLTADGVSNCAFYVIKYLLKLNPKEQRLQQALSLNLSETDYDFIWNLVKSRCVYSKGFGLSKYADFQSLQIVQYLRDCIVRTPEDSRFPCYYSPDSPLSFPLCPFYRSFSYIYSPFQELEFYMRNPIIVDSENYNMTDATVINNAFENVKKVVDNNDLSDYFDLI